MRTFVLVCTILVGFVSAQNDAVSADDILRQSGGSYGDDQGAVNQDLVDSIFNTGGNNAGNNGGDNGGNAHVGPPKGEVVDTKYDNCSYYEPDGYRCVPYYQCADGYVITDGTGLFDIRLLDDVQLDPEGSKCESYLEVCCRDADFEGQPLPTRPPPITTPKPTTPKPKPQKYQSQCGRRNIDGIGVRIQNDLYKSSTQFGEWPHMCAVLNQAEVAGEEVNLYVCGGSLIAPDTILTGAHCVDGLDYSTIKVRCGEWDTQQTIEPYEHQDRHASHISIHPAFNPRNIQNDFALIHLESPFKLNSHIDTICLPDQNAGPYSYLTEQCFATGWGKDEFGAKGEYQVILKQVEMDMVGHYDCEERLRGTRLGPRFELDNSFVCAGGEPDKDTCKGDGGGPLVCPTRAGVEPHNQVYVQSGIVAWGIGCGEDVPGVYANVSDSLCFIDWATKCYRGQEVDNYGYYGCHRWAKREYCGYKKQISDLEYKISVEQNLREKGKKFREVRKLQALLPNFEAAIQGCQTGLQDYNCDIEDYYGSDLSGLVRDDVGGGAKDAHDDRAAAPVNNAVGDDYSGASSPQTAGGAYGDPLVKSAGDAEEDNHEDDDPRSGDAK